MSNSTKREKAYLENFKIMLRDMLFLLRTSLQAETVSMHWINDNRSILVLENYATNQKNVVFKDRVEKKHSYLGKYSAIKSVTRLEVGTHINMEELEHYTSAPPVRYIYLIPFKYNADTVAITAVETSEKSRLTEVDEAAFSAYEEIQNRLLQTYLELSDLSEKQIQWSEYDEVAGKLAKTGSPMELAGNLLADLQGFAGHKGGALLLARGMDDWHTVLSSEKASHPPPVGLPVQAGSISEQALSSGESQFNSHFNANPKRISAHEPLCNGATLAVPITHHQRRQLLALVYNENPLVFTEAVKHKLNNLCRIAGLKIEAMLPNLDVHDDIFGTPFGSYRQELFMECVAASLKNMNDINGVMRTWVGMVTIGNVADLRTKYRLEDLMDLQRVVLRHLRPQNFGVTGILSEYSDYIYTFVLQSSDEAAISHWHEGVRKTFESPVDFASGTSEKVIINIGYIEPDGETEADSIMQQAKRVMNEAVKNKKFIIQG